MNFFNRLHWMSSTVIFLVIWHLSWDTRVSCILQETPHTSEDRAISVKIHYFTMVRNESKQEWAKKEYAKLGVAAFFLHFHSVLQWRVRKLSQRTPGQEKLNDNALNLCMVEYAGCSNTAI